MPGNINLPTNFTLQSTQFGSTPIWGASKSATVGIVNRDLTNPVIIGFDSGMNPVNCVIIDPLGFEAFDGNADLYAQALSGSPLIQAVPGLTQWAPSPAQVAAQINALGLMKDTTGQTINTTAGGTTTAVNGTTTAVNGVPTGIANTGVPLLNKANNVINTGAFTITAGNTHTVPPVTINQIGYEIFLVIADQAGANGTPFVQVQMVWSDSATGQVVSQEYWTLASGSLGSGGMSYFGTGPSKGDTLNVAIVNGGTVTIGMTVAMNQHSRIYQRDDWRTLTPLVAVNGFTNPNNDPAGNILATFSFNINAATTSTRLIPLYAGLCTYSIAPTTAATFQWSIHPQDITAGVANSQLFFQGVTATNGTNGMATFPRSVCTIQINNNSAGAAIYAGGFAIQEQPQ